MLQGVILEENTTNESMSEFPEQTQAALEALDIDEMIETLELLRILTPTVRPAVNTDELIEQSNSRKPNIQYQFKNLQHKAKHESQQIKNPKKSKPIIPYRGKK